MILGTGIGMAMPKMECKINLRSGNQDAWRRWTVNRNDVITAHGLDALMDNQLMPTVDVIGERFPNLSSAERQETLVASTKQYLSENTQLYFLMKDSVDISGAYEQLDTDYINKSFVGAAGSRSLRDGLGFLNWVESFFDITKDDAQILLKRQFSAKMKINPTGVSIAVLEKTWLCLSRGSTAWCSRTNTVWSTPPAPPAAPKMTDLGTAPRSPPMLASADCPSMHPDRAL